MKEYLLSVGIDLGTTTTQMIFSRLEVENSASVSSIPRIQIVSKEIIYRSHIHFTPLLDRRTIDVKKVREILEEEYLKAGLTPKELSAGAVIITGETARKENSEAVLRTLSGLAGDFVVATAGSDLESILAGRGAGTAEMSKKNYGRPLANLDIGGGTTNTAIFIEGEPVDTSCLDIGGRQIILDPETLTLNYVAEKVSVFTKNLGLNLKEGQTAKLEDLTLLCQKLAEIMGQSLGLVTGSAEDLDLFITAHPLKEIRTLAGLTFSGGVADYIYNDYDPGKPFPYRDIGPLLGHCIRNSKAFQGTEILEPKETIRATVVGAGSNSMEISGSTIAISDPDILPLKNIPILKLTEDDQAKDYKYFSSRLSEKTMWFKEENSDRYQQIAVAFRGTFNPSFDKVKYICSKVMDGLSDYLRTNDLLVVVLDQDMAKSLGNALMNALPGKKIICLDTVKVENGDYIDIGIPLSHGRVVPVVVKTLIFGK